MDPSHYRRPSESSLTDIPLPHAGLGTKALDWTTIHAGELVANQEVLVVDSQASIETACEALIVRGVSSAPVYDKESKSFVGMFDYADMLTYVLLVLRRVRIPEQDDQDARMAELIGHALRAESVNVKLATDLSRDNPYYSVLPETSLLQVAEIFAKGIHRVAVTDGAGGLKGILTQSNLIHYLAEHMFDFPALTPTLEKTLEALDVGKGPVITVQMEAMVVDALEAISKNDVSSVAVVDQRGHLFGNISLTDIKHVLQHHKQSLLYATCTQMVAHVKLEQGAKTGQDTVPVFDIHLNNTLRLAMRKLAATRAHRLWVTDQYGYVEGVITLTDVIQLILTNTKP